MSRDNSNEIHELAMKMSEAISTEIHQRNIADESKLQAVLRENGWCKASEIFAEIERSFCGFEKEASILLYCDFAELKKKYKKSEGAE